MEPRKDRVKNLAPGVKGSSRLTKSPDSADSVVIDDQ